MYNSVFVSFAQHQSFQRIDKNHNNGFKNQLYPYTFELKNKTYCSKMSRLKIWATKFCSTNKSDC